MRQTGFGLPRVELTPRPSRRDVLKLGMVAAAGLPGCSAVPQPRGPETPQVRGGLYSHGATGRGLKDTLEPYFPVINPDIGRCLQLHEPLQQWNESYEIEPRLPSRSPPTRPPPQWTIRICDEVVLRHGKTVAVEDVMHSLATVIDPNNTSNSPAVTDDRTRPWRRAPTREGNKQ